MFEPPKRDGFRPSEHPKHLQVLSNPPGEADVGPSLAAASPGADSCDRSLEGFVGRATAGAGPTDPSGRQAMRSKSSCFGFLMFFFVRKIWGVWREKKGNMISYSKDSSRQLGVCQLLKRQTCVNRNDWLVSNVHSPKCQNPTVFEGFLIATWAC